MQANAFTEATGQLISRYNLMIISMIFKLCASNVKTRLTQLKRIEGKYELPNVNPGKSSAETFLSSENAMTVIMIYELIYRITGFWTFSIVRYSRD
jgi:hypothetical protein